MTNGNVKLWFARNKKNEIVTIDDFCENDQYSCPICGSTLIPKAIDSKSVSPHFAHLDKEKCTPESMIHWWFKHKFIQPGDSFSIVADSKKFYICKTISVEQSYKVGERIYTPDVTVLTECGQTIYFEMNFRNKKQISDYLDVWLDLKNTVVEIDIKQLLNNASCHVFSPLFYEGKCFNTKKNDTYYNTIGKYKELLYKQEITDEIKNRIRKLDWFWKDVVRYKKGEIEIDYMVDLIDLLKKTDGQLIDNVLKKSFCSDLRKEYFFKTQYCHFHLMLPNDHLLKNAVSQLNKIFKKVDKSYRVKLKRNADYSYHTEWWFGRKQKCKTVNYYFYDVELVNDEGYFLAGIPITNRIHDIRSEFESCRYIEQKLKERLNEK